MRDVMLDLETMGTTNSAAIVSIGAVVFDEKMIGQTFYARVSLADAMKHGGEVEGSTIMWWLRQSDAARQTLQDSPQPLAVALTGFNAWLQDLSLEAGGMLRLWGNGAMFDNVIIESAYRRLDLEPAWTYKAHRCFRTLKNMFPVDLPAFDGAEHNALDDAIYQAKWVHEICAIHRFKLA
jgi:hypothetical protein